MRQLTFLFVLLLLTYLTACTDEPNQTNFMVSVKNSSNNPATMEAYSEKNVVFIKVLGNGKNSPLCTYVDENFRGMFVNYCGIDSVAIKFNNGKGYISTKNNSGDFNFSNKRNPLLPNGGFKANGNIYEFIVTQQDFENAFELPK